MTERRYEPVTLGEIKELAEVGRPTVSNWRRRHDTFPLPAGGSESKPLFDAEEIASWLDERPVPDGVPNADGVLPTYGERFRHGLRLRRLIALKHDGENADRLVGEALAVLAMDGEGKDTIERYLPPHLQPDVARADPRVVRVVRELATELGSPGAAADAVLELAGRLESDLAMDTTPPVVADLISSLVGSVEAGPGQPSVINLCAGTGELLFALDGIGGRGDIVAVEPDPLRRKLLTYRLWAHWDSPVDVCAHPEELGILRPWEQREFEDDTTEPWGFPTADFVLADPPYVPGERERDEDGPLRWAHEAVNRLNPDGRGYVVVPSWTLSRPRTTVPTSAVRMREELLAHDALAAIVQLPRRIHPFRTGAEHALLVLRRDADPEARGRVLLVDADRIARRIGTAWPRHVVEILHTGRSPVAEEARYAAVSATGGAESLSDGRSVLPAHRLASREQGLDHLAATLEARQKAFDALPQLKEWLGALVARKRSRTVRHVKVGDQLKAGPLKLLSGHRIRESDIGDAGVPVIGREEMLGALAIGGRRILPEDLAAYPQAAITNRGDVFLLTEHGVRAQVDDAGGCVLLAPVQGLRIAAYQEYQTEPTRGEAPDSRNLWMRPHTLAHLLAAPRNQQRGSGSLVRRVSVRDMDLPQLPVEEIADLEEILAEAERHRADVQRQLAALDTLAERLAAGVADGDLSLRKRSAHGPGPRD
ncbi:N-6 DNA methylase [Streptomyces sp. NPDC002785]|uniref:N-6 DNA methylase n=1 Tax=Streptomyces sp. NPDC002785 TaxID=3154543 RepID=UPI0033280853